MKLNQEKITEVCHTLLPDLQWWELSPRELLLSVTLFSQKFVQFVVCVPRHQSDWRRWQSLQRRKLVEKKNSFH